MEEGGSGGFVPRQGCHPSSPAPALIGMNTVIKATLTCSQDIVSYFAPTLMASPKNHDRLILPVGCRDHCQGNSIAKITLVQYGDYQCPTCYMAHQLILCIQKQLGDQIRFVFRQFPQPEIHPEALHAAEAAEAAASQNRFWEMHNHLLEHQSHLFDSNLVEYAIALYLDVNQFLHEMADDCHVEKIQADMDSGRQSGVIKTPTFFINGLKYADDKGLEGLLDAVVQASDT